MERRSRLSLLMMMFLLLLSACDPVGDELDLEHPDDQLMAEQLEIWWDGGVDAPHQLFAAEALEKHFTKARFEFQIFYPPHFPSLFVSNHSLSNLLEMMRSGSSPDLIVFDIRFMPLMIEAGYLDPIPDTYGLEIDYDIITNFRSFAPDLAFYALPFGRIAEGLFYNKAIFDERQVPYPKDGMTWDEVLDLAAILKRDSKNQIGVTTFDSMASQLSLRLYDPETERFNFDSPEWKEFTRILLAMNDLEEHYGEHYRSYLMSSFTVGNTAMIVGPLYGNIGIRPGLLNNESQLRQFHTDWDIVSFPVFDDGQGLRPAGQMLGIGVPARSKNKDDAYKIMRYLLSHEMQLDNSRKGLVSLRSDAETFNDEFGSSSMLAGKSVTSLFSDAPRGSMDPVFEFIRLMNSHLHNIVNSDEYLRDTIVDMTQNQFNQYIPRMMGERAQFIEEMRSKF